ncbi:hypothetical protein BHE74_00024646 [Ensete ventricosum]|nr:hypothetical protein BHE74_00024646 [Ensete ventricosum]
MDLRVTISTTEAKQEKVQNKEGDQHSEGCRHEKRAPTTVCVTGGKRRRWCYSSERYTGEGGLAGAGWQGWDSANRRRRMKAKAVVSWWRREVVFPVKRAWLAVSSRVETRKHGKGILKLYDDVQMCGYQDVQVMWEILTKPEMETPKRLKQRKGSIWRLSTWCRRTRFS